MSLPKKRVETNHRSVNRLTIQSSHRAAGRPESTGFSRTASESKGEKKHTFAEDFNMEHSLSGVTVTVITISSGSDSAESGTVRSLYAESMNSPSCVYLG